MTNLLKWRSGTALFIALGMSTSAVAPLTLSTRAIATPAPHAIAQLFPPSNNTYPNQQVAIPAGTRIPVRYDDAEKVVVLPNETSALTLRVARNLRSSYGQILIPAGSQIKGRLQPANGGSQFFAEELILPDNTTYPISAESRVVTRRETIRRGVDGSSILKGTAAGAGAATILSGVLGNRRITIPKVLAGAGAGALGGLLLGRNTVEVISINPNTDLTLTLTSSLALR
jgi:hypothetical protein